jgi:predicted nucleotidyltransferase
MGEPPVNEIVRKIVNAFHPRRIVLFGSRAQRRGEPDSDVDLCVEMSTDLPPRERRRAISRLFGVRNWAMDVVVYTPEEAQRLRNVVGTLLYTIEREGQVLYERS